MQHNSVSLQLHYENKSECFATVLTQQQVNTSNVSETLLVDAKDLKYE